MVVDRKVQSVLDVEASPVDHDPRLSVDLNEATATIGDSPAKGAPYSVSFSLKEPR